MPSLKGKDRKPDPDLQGPDIKLKIRLRIRIKRFRFRNSGRSTGPEVGYARDNIMLIADYSSTRWGKNFFVAEEKKSIREFLTFW